MSEAEARLKMANHITEIIMSFVEISSEEDEQDAIRETENLVDSLIESLDLELVSGPLSNGKTLFSIKLLNPQEYIVR